MCKNKRYKDFLDKLAVLTRENKLKWKRVIYSDTDLETNFEFNKKLIGRDPKSMCYWRSFYVDYKGSFIVLFSMRMAQGDPRLRITPYYSESGFEPIDFDMREYMTELERLENLVLSKFPVPEDIVDEILKMN